MTTKCASFVRGRVLRATRLDGCGRPVIGDDSVVVSKGWTSVAYTANTDEGEEINVTNAAGETCVREPAKPKFLGYTVEITFCNVDPDVFALLTGQRTIVDDVGDVIGFTMDTAISVADVNFSLEVWAGSPAGNACDNPGATGGTYGYFLLPFVQGGVVGDFTIENAEVTFTVSGAATLDGNHWGTGLYPVVLNAGGSPALLVDPLVSTDHLLAIITGMAPPAAHCGARPYLDPETPTVTGVTTTPLLLEVTFSPTPVGTDPWWIDYGDGSWEYIADGGDAVHTYDTAGTYSFIAYRGPGSASGTVTVTAV